MAIDLEKEFKEDDEFINDWCKEVPINPGRILCRLSRRVCMM